MARARSPRLLVIVAVAAAAALGVLWAALDGGEPERDDSVSATGPAVEAPPAEVGAPVALRTTRTDDPPREIRAGPTTVLFPLRVELELVESALLPRIDGRTIDRGARARLAGRIVGPHGEPARATVHFVAGPNEGRSLATDADGAFGVHDLWPGVDVVEVRGPGIIGSRRELRFANGSETLLNIGYGMPGGVEGRVIDETGEPVVGARVTADGQPTITGENGHFSLPRVAAGPVLFEVAAEGYAPHRQEIGIQAGTVIPSSVFEVTLAPEATLVVTLATDVGGPGPAFAHIDPAPSGFERRFNWAAVRPVELLPGAPVTIRGLPPGPVSLRVHRVGAVARPAATSVMLTRGGSAAISVQLEPAPRVVARAVDDGRAAAGARVRLTAGDVPAATLALVRGERAHLDDEVRRHLPATVQEGVADAAGEVAFTDHGPLLGARLVEAWSADGTKYAVAGVPPGTAEVALELRPLAARHDAVLQMALSPRIQGLPVELVVAGRPQPAFVVDPRDDLVIEGLEPGRWRVDASWWGERVVRLESLDVRGTVRISVALPPGAVEGQDEETWLRAGEQYPRR